MIICGLDSLAPIFSDAFLPNKTPRDLSFYNSFLNKYASGLPLITLHLFMANDPAQQN